MPIFKKGAIFTMGGKEYEVIAEGNDDPASCLMYVPRHEKDTADPLTIRMWKAEAKLARGDIMLNEENAPKQKNIFFPPISDPLEQIAELKKQIHAIERRRVTLLKKLDPTGQVLVQDNIVRPNKSFDIWQFTLNGPSEFNPAIQYIKLRGIVLTISAREGYKEHFLFNIADQFQPYCKIIGNALTSEGAVKLDLAPGLKTVQGKQTDILKDNLAGKIELTINVKINCKVTTGITVFYSNISKCSHIREVNSQVFQIGKLAFPEIGEHTITIMGLCVDIYSTGKNGTFSPSMPYNI